MTRKTSEAQMRAVRAWEERNPELKRFYRTRTNARTFARKYAKSIDDIQELVDIFNNENPNANKKEKGNGEEQEGADR